MPTPLYVLMVVLLALSLATLAYSIPRHNNREELLALVLVTIIFGTVLLLIANFDRPFSGVLKLKPTAMLRAAADINADYEETYRVKAPCDAEGRPTIGRVHSHG